MFPGKVCLDCDHEDTSYIDSLLIGTHAYLVLAECPSSDKFLKLFKSFNIKSITNDVLYAQLTELGREPRKNMKCVIDYCYRNSLPLMPAGTTDEEIICTLNNYKQLFNLEDVMLIIGEAHKQVILEDY